MKNLLENKLNLIIAGVIVIILLAIGIPLTVNTIETPTEDIVRETYISDTIPPETTGIEKTEPPTELKIVTKKVFVDKAEKKAYLEKKKAKLLAKKKAEARKKKPAEKKKADAEKKSEDKKSDKKKKKSKPNFSYATAPTQANVSYNAQWNAGYLVAIDNPDRNYHPAHVELSDYDRDLLERLCYGEFGDGGFVGAALVAQAVKDAMNTYGITSVKQVIKQFSYDGRTDVPAGKTIKDAVTYVFDMDKSAVQHRIIYMYDTAYVDSEFHETQNYVCTFKSTRFFDKK